MNYTYRRKDHQHQNTIKNTKTQTYQNRERLRDYYHEQFEIHKNDLRNSWKLIKEMVGKVDQHKVKKTHNIPDK